MTKKIRVGRDWYLMWNAGSRRSVLVHACHNTFNTQSRGACHTCGRVPPWDVLTRASWYSVRMGNTLPADWNHE